LVANIFFCGEREHSARCRWHSAGGFLKDAHLKLSGTMPDRAGKMPALPK
jgi:hypothetical protein